MTHRIRQGHAGASAIAEKTAPKLDSERERAADAETDVAESKQSRFPKLIEGTDWRKLPIGPTEAFVLSRVDGETSETDIAAAVGLSIEQVQQTLGRLAELGAISFFEAESKAQRGPRRVRSTPSIRVGPIIEERRTPESAHPAAALYDPSELDEAVDIDIQRKRLILDLYYRLDSITHYELLGVDPSGDKRAIKAKYYEVVNIFHPDRYFGKNIGSFKPKLERLFARLTEAHDVLTRNASRAEYDKYLATQQRTRHIAEALTDADAHAAELERVRRKIEEEARLAERAAHLPPPPSVPPPPIATTVRNPERSRSPLPLSQRTPLDAEARRRALARKLGVATANSPRTTSAPPRPPAPSPSLPPEAARDELKRRYEQRMSQARDRQVQQYVDSAETALATNDPVSAANALRIAVSLRPDDTALGERLTEAQSRAATELADSYWEQAKYEERDGRFQAAARSYERVAQGKPSALVFERVAYSLLMAETDLKTAVEYGKRAVMAAPDEAQNHITLARVYLAAGMKQSAIGEFERAATLAPKDDSIKDWLRRLK